jgi:hypothetical protein
MATVRKWSNVAVAMQSALAAADTVTAITKANPGVATATAHGLANGDYVLLTVNGMYQLNGKVVRVANVTANTFELEGVNTTSYDTFSSGTAEAITFGNSITTATDINASGGDFDFVDTTTIHGNVKTQIPGAANPATYTFNNLWDVSDAGLLAMKSASDSQAQRAFKFTFGSGGQIMVFAGYVGATLLPTGSAQDKVVTPATITMFGTPTYYAS